MKIMRRFTLSMVIAILVVLPMGYLTAKTLSLQKQIEALRNLYPQLTDDEIATVQAVKKVEDSVVSIVIEKEVFKPSERLLDLGNGFQIVVPGELQSQGKQVVGQGSGFVVGEDGLIVTNKHVVADKTADYVVVLNTGKRYPVDVMAVDPFNDIALVKVRTGSSFPSLIPLTLGSTRQLRVGQTVIAIGNAKGEFNNSVTKGVISGMNRAILAGSEVGGQTERLVKILQTDAAINPGNSGGPLLNTSGEVVGINTAVDRGAENIGFAIPVEDIKFVLNAFKKDGRVARPYLGIRYAAINADVQRNLRLPYSYGVLLTAGTQGEQGVIPGGPAAAAGLKTGDIILEFQGKKLGEDNDLAALIRGKAVGAKVSLKIWRAATRQEDTVSVTLQEMK